VASSGGQRDLEILDGLSQRPFDAAAHEQTVVEAMESSPRLKFDYEAVVKAVLGGREVTLVARVGQTALTALVLDKRFTSKRRNVIRSSTSRPSRRTTMRASSPGTLHRDPGSIRTKPGQN
jgi:hypothetical protein